jgi:DNA adenine methylase
MNTKHDPKKYLKPPFCRQGNKYMIRREIMEWFPVDGVRVYVELFAGSGAIFFNLGRDGSGGFGGEKKVKYVLNDLDRGVVDRFRLLKKVPLDGDFRHDLNTLGKLKTFYRDVQAKGAGAPTLEDKLIFEKIRTCNGFSGKPVSKPEEIYRAYNPDSILKDLPAYQDRLAGVVLSNKDYEDVVKKYDGVGVFFFIDPPYQGTQKSTGYSSGSEAFDYERLEGVLRGIRGRFLMTLNDSPYIRRLFKGFHIVPLKVYTKWGNSSGGVDTRKEVIVMN